MLLDKYKRNYRFKSNQKGNDKYLWISLIASAIIVIAIYYFS